MSIEDRLSRIEQRQEALIAAMHGLTDIQAQTRDLVTELMEWLQQPGSSDLADALKEVAQALKAQDEKLAHMTGLMVKLPAQVARAVTAGEIA
ncbi:MAG: hypothetical protein ACJ8AW_52235 [Rhodopila sp.]